MSRLIDALRRSGGTRLLSSRRQAVPPSAHADTVLAALGYSPKMRRRGPSRRTLYIFAAAAAMLLAVGGWVMVSVYGLYSRAALGRSIGRAPSTVAPRAASRSPQPVPLKTDATSTPPGPSRVAAASEPPIAQFIPARSAPLETERRDGLKTVPNTTTAEGPAKTRRQSVDRSPSAFARRASARQVGNRQSAVGRPPSRDALRRDKSDVPAARVPQTPAPPLAASSSPAAPAGASAVSDEDHFKLAVYYQRAGDLDTALTHYRALLQRNELNAEAHNNLGLLYQQKGQLDQAIPQFQRAILIDPKYAKAHNNLGVALLRSGNADASATEFQAVLAGDPKDVDALVNLALALKAAGNQGKAQETLLRAIAVRSTSAAAHYNLALLYEQDQEMASAIDHYRAFLTHAGVEYANLTGDVRKRVETLSARLVP